MEATEYLAGFGDNDSIRKAISKACDKYNALKDLFSPDEPMTGELRTVLRAVSIPVTCIPGFFIVPHTARAVLTVLLAHVASATIPNTCLHNSKAVLPRRLLATIPPCFPPLSVRNTVMPLSFTAV
jgi:hypothetical protein